MPNLACPNFYFLRVALFLLIGVYPFIGLIPEEGIFDCAGFLETAGPTGLAEGAINLSFLTGSSPLTVEAADTLHLPSLHSVQ